MQRHVLTHGILLNVLNEPEGNVFIGLMLEGGLV